MLAAVYLTDGSGDFSLQEHLCKGGCRCKTDSGAKFAIQQLHEGVVPIYIFKTCPEFLLKCRA